jgi:tetratricopeptide (TPR) repeat protein
MKRVFLVMLACVVLPAGMSARINSDEHPSAETQETTQKTESLSPELIEAEKLNAEVVKLFKAGKFAEATPLAKRVLRIREKALAPGHKLIISALTNLGEVYRARRKYKESEAYYQRLLANFEETSAQDHVAMSNVLDILAFLNYMQLNYEEAENLYQRALALRERANGAEHLEVSKSLINLAEFYRLRGDYKRAEPLYQRAIKIKGRALGPDDKDVEKALERYSCLFYSMNQPEKLKDIRSQFSFLQQKDATIVNTGEILNGKAISLPTPEHPGTILRWNIPTIVAIKITIDETGRVIGVEDMCHAHPVLADAAVRAAYKARFAPTMLSGVPVKVTGVIIYKFATR